MINIHEAKTNLSRLLDAVQRGKQVVIAKAGHPVARLVPYIAAKRTLARPGSLSGTDWTMSDAFDAPLDSEFEQFAAPVNFASKV